MKKQNEKDETSFAERVYAAVCKIPEGKVATYGQIAWLIGNGGAARAVGNALHVNPYFGTVPCHRVVNAAGFLARDFGFGGAEKQREMLEAEGIVVIDGKVDLAKYQWLEACATELTDTL